MLGDILSRPTTRQEGHEGRATEKEVDIRSNLGDETDLRSHVEAIPGDSTLYSRRVDVFEEDAPEGSAITEIRENLDKEEDYLVDSQLRRMARRGLVRFMNMRKKSVAFQQGVIDGFQEWIEMSSSRVQNRDLGAFGALKSWEIMITEEPKGTGLHSLARIASCLQSIPASEVSCERMISRQGFIYNGRNNRMAPELFEARAILSYKAAKRKRELAGKK